MTSSFSRNGSSGWSTLPSSMVRPEPLAHHSLLWNPLPEKRQANRTGGWLETSRPAGVSPQTRTDSSQGRAIETPRPRSIARRESA